MSKQDAHGNLGVETSLGTIFLFCFQDYFVETENMTYGLVY